jgi:hypothetical protein
MFRPKRPSSGVKKLCYFEETVVAMLLGLLFYIHRPCVRLCLGSYLSLACWCVYVSMTVSTKKNSATYKQQNAQM